IDRDRSAGANTRRANSGSGCSRPSHDVVAGYFLDQLRAPILQQFHGRGVAEAELAALAGLLLDDDRRPPFADQLLAALQDVQLIALAIDLDEVDARQREAVERAHLRGMLAT